MRARVVVSALLAPLVVLGAPLAAAAPAPATATSEVVVSGDQAATTLLRLPKASTVRSPFGTSPDFLVTSTSRAVALVLEEQVTRKVFTAVSVRTAAGRQSFIIPTGRYDAFQASGHYELFKTFGNDIVLAAGTYRVTLVTDGPAVATLRLPGQRAGRTQIRPRTPVRSVFASPEDLRPSPTSNTFAAEERLVSQPRHLYLQVLVVETEIWTSGQYSYCRRQGGENQDGVADDPYVCDGGSRTLVNERIATTTPDAKVLVSAATDPPEGFGFGVGFTGQGVITERSYTTVRI